ncbi:fibroblast growth factor receptor 3-like isoform X2 [Stylophora pistillata]|uniref:fibroblast growth factor receptor 3-like isoform X2 n=1 Tax=Stylophora pistillata TaxID=50429 RepID=UPI000C053847|nr:fibroblast growth factor receptor 3-like isoform X2 [Stylophora pistillata]
MCKDQVIVSYFATALLFTPLAEADVKFKIWPSNPTYVNNGSTAKLVWDYSDPNNDIRGIAFDVLVNSNRGKEFKRILVKQNGVVQEHPDIPSAYKGRVSIEGAASLVIEKVTPTDNTIFGCKLFESRTNPRNQVRIIVAEPPTINLSPVHGSYREGSVVNLSCTASGIPEPDITWILDGKVISSGQGAALLKFNSLTKTDDGWYTCRANNTADTINKHIILLVYHPPTIENVTSSSSKSWIGHTVTLECKSNGVPTPTLIWYKPDGREINRVRARENKVQVTPRSDQDFGDYKCIAANGLSPSDDTTVKITQIKKPGTPFIVSSEESIQASSLTVRWTAPADDGGSPITGYMAIILKGDAEINSVNVTDPAITSYTFGGLERDTNYAVKVIARNGLFEGDPIVTTLKTNFEGPPAAVEIYGLPSETTDDEITLKWKEPEDNGKEIIQYTLYQRLVTNGKLGEWTVVRKIMEVSINELTVKLERGKVYEFTITATNQLGESLVDETKIKRLKLVDLQNNNRIAKEECKCSCHDVIYIAIIGVLVLIILLSFIYILWLHKKGAGGKQRVKDEKAYEKDIELEDLELSCPDSSDIAQHPAEYIDIKETSLDDTQTQTAGQVTDYAALLPSTRSWEVSKDHVKIEKIIGKGAFGQVAKGTVENLCGRPGRTTIAIKMLKDDASDSDERDLEKELETMKQLKPHPHVIKLLGCVTETEPLLVLIEYVPFGDLLGYLRKSRGLNDTYFKDADIKPQSNLTSQQLMKFAWQIADGMSYLSSKSIIHRDLAARNVLVGENETCKVTDLGMARDVQQENVYERKTKGRLPVKWTAYEALLYGTYTTKSDVWFPVSTDGWQENCETTSAGLQNA